jgi:GNAT superfamily N-acetyltransferase
MMTAYWTNPQNLRQVVCRPALPLDTTDVMEFTKKIWEGDDYIPYVWEKWLNDSDGLMAVAEFGGRAVGMSKLTRLSPADWWMEGLRVDPEYEGRGIASRLHRYMLETWVRTGGGVLRLVTSSKREAVHHLCNKAGFSKPCEFAAYSAPAIRDNDPDFVPVNEKEVDQALAALKSSPVLPLFCGLIDLYWSWSRPHSWMIAESIQRGHAWWWKGSRGLSFFWEDDDEEEKYLKIQGIACPLESLKECLQDCRRLAGKLGYHKVEWIASTHGDIISPLEAAGFVNKWDMTLFLFEKPRPGEQDV